jgi:uncharacterized membrane protein YsdA (DUF1294 family)
VIWPVVALYGVMSAVTFVAFAVDKRAAGRGRRRVPERTLHTLELLGGWPGAALGVHLLRHKSSKRTYLVVFWAIGLLHALAWGAGIYLRAR